MIADLLYIFTGLIGFFVLLLIVFRYQSNRIVNLFLVVIFFTISVRFLMHGLYNLGFHDKLNLFYFNNRNALQLLIPCFYLYFRNLIANRKKFRSCDLTHFILPLFVLVFINFIPPYLFPQTNFDLYLLIYFSCFSCYYYYRSYLLLNKEVWSSKKGARNQSKQELLLYKWTRLLSYLFLLILIRLLASLFIEIKTDSYSSGYSYQWISAIFWLVIYFRILIAPEILHGYDFLQEKVNILTTVEIRTELVWNKVLKNDLISNLDLKLKDKIEENWELYIPKIEESCQIIHPFRDKEFSISDFSRLLNIPKSHLVYLFKYHSNISFLEYKKRCRIQDACELMKKGYLNKHKFNSLATKVGFATYNPFYSSFKELMQIAPQDYLNTL